MQSENMIEVNVDIREVHISTRKVRVKSDATRHEILEAALNESEMQIEYSHTMDSDNHVITDLNGMEIPELNP